MTRKQMNIPGTERKAVPEIEAAAEELREITAEHADLGKKKTEKKHALIAIMRAHKVKLYRYHDEGGEEIEAEIDEEPKVSVHKTGEAEPEIGEGISDAPSNPDRIMGGLIAEAQKAQQDAGVSESDDGDVTVPETSAPKATRGSKRKAKAK